MEFRKFKEKVSEQFTAMERKYKLYDVAFEKDFLWEVYLNSFPEGSNPLFKERTEHDCNSCKNFIRRAGGIVAIDENNQLISIWDINLEGAYGEVAKALSTYIKSCEIYAPYLNDEKKVGTDFNVSLLESGETLKWHHFFLDLPKEYASDSIGAIQGTARSNYSVFLRGLTELTQEALSTTLELIDDDEQKLYRGKEFRNIVNEFFKLKQQFNMLPPAQRRRFAWRKMIPTLAGFKNSVIGTLVSDLSKDVPIDDAVKMFEAKVAPANYKRPTAVVSKSMILNAQEKIAALGMTESLNRRHATIDDISVNNVIFVDRSVYSAENVFEELAGSVYVSPDSFKGYPEIDIKDFMKTIVPNARSIEFLMENRFENNLVNLIAPVNPEAPGMFKWGNNFSWAYNGNLADSIKTRVKAAGGKIDGWLRISLAWFNTDDLDLHVIEPSGNEIYFHNKRSRTSGTLDVDMNVSGDRRDAVENIVYTDESRMIDDVYTVIVNNFHKREDIDVGFEVEVEFGGVIYRFSYPKSVRYSENITVLKFRYSRNEGIKIIQSIGHQETTKELWNLNTCHFHKVQMLMHSPNHWDGEETGNKHWFFMLQNCLNPDPVRGFFNEYLKGELNEHRKVFEMLSSKLKAPFSERQLSGLGFSSTIDNNCFVKIQNRVYKVIL